MATFIREAKVVELSASARDAQDIQDAINAELSEGWTYRGVSEIRANLYIIFDRDKKRVF